MLIPVLKIGTTLYGMTRMVWRKAEGDSLRWRETAGHASLPLAFVDGLASGFGNVALAVGTIINPYAAVVGTIMLGADIYQHRGAIAKFVRVERIKRWREASRAARAATDKALHPETVSCS